MSDTDTLLAVLEHVNRPTTKDRLASALDWWDDGHRADTRRMERAVFALRRKPGAPLIGSSGRGYWIERDPERYALNLEGRRRRAITQLLTVRAERRALKERRRVDDEQAGGTLGL